MRRRKFYAQFPRCRSVNQYSAITTNESLTESREKANRGFMRSNEMGNNNVTS